MAQNNLPTYKGRRAFSQPKKHVAYETTQDIYGRQDFNITDTSEIWGKFATDIASMWADLDALELERQKIATENAKVKWAERKEEITAERSMMDITETEPESIDFSALPSQGISILTQQQSTTADYLTMLKRLTEANIITDDQAVYWSEWYNKQYGGMN